MARELDVHLHGSLIGRLAQGEYGDIRFQYAESWLGTPGAIPVTYSLPLREAPFFRRECTGFFGGILPEGEKREIIARNLGISARNDLAMLEEIGGECAGAVTFVRAGESIPQQAGGYSPLTESELADKLRKLPRGPLLAGDGRQ